jgi:cation diffusion facilitator family transporter
MRRDAGSQAYNSANPVAIRRTAWATAITFIMMIVEIVTGYMTGSMALLADGWHMGTHVLALGLSWMAFVLSARLSRDQRFSFGTGKLEVLASFVSALLLLGVGIWMGLESVARLLAPTEVRFSEAMVVAIVGLWVNLICALLLHQKASHPISLHADAQGGANTHHSHHHHGHHHHHHSEEGSLKAASAENLNLKAAYIHVLADALTSILAIVALVFGQLTGLPQMDSLMGLVGTLMVLLWAKSLIAQTMWILMDGRAPDALIQRIDAAVIAWDPQAVVVDAKVWLIASGRHACNLVLESRRADALEDLRHAILQLGFVAHLNIEVVAQTATEMPRTPCRHDSA